LIDARVVVDSVDIGGGTPGAAPPLTLGLVLAQLACPRPRYHTRDEDALDRFVSSMCSGGMPKGQLCWRTMARRSQNSDSEQTLTGGARRSLPAM